MTTGVDGLEVIIAEAGIFTGTTTTVKNGLVTSPGGYPGETLTPAELTYSRNFGWRIISVAMKSPS